MEHGFNICNMCYQLCEMCLNNEHFKKYIGCRQCSRLCAKCREHDVYEDPIMRLIMLISPSDH
jgi:hypothetical protein